MVSVFCPTWSHFPCTIFHKKNLYKLHVPPQLLLEVCTNILLEYHPRSMARFRAHHNVSLTSKVKQDGIVLRQVVGNPAQHELERVPAQSEIDSASISPSFGMSIYNASRIETPTRSDDTSDKENQTLQKEPFQASAPSSDMQKVEASDNIVPAPHIVRFVNRPDGTPLFTIIEQRSLATLKSKASNLAFSIRATQSNPCGKRGSVQEVITRGPKAASADDVTLPTYLPQHGTSSSAVSSRAEEGLHRAQHLPFQPPFKPPHRRKTPEGIQRWPGEPHSSSQAHASARVGLRQASMAALNGNTSQLRRALSGYIHRGFGSRQRPTSRPWRPPASGHFTAGHDSLVGHPFQNLPVAVVDPIAARRSEPLHITLPGTVVPNSISAAQEIRTQSHPRSGTPARMALASMSGNAVPSNPARALSPLQARTASIPSQRIKRKALPSHSSANSTVHLRGKTYSSDTLRTLDILQQFPHPPSCTDTSHFDSPRRPLPLFAPRPQMKPSIRFIARDGSPSLQDENARYPEFVMMNNNIISSGKDSALRQSRSTIDAGASDSV